MGTGLMPVLGSLAGTTLAIYHSHHITDHMENTCRHHRHKFIFALLSCNSKANCKAQFCYTCIQNLVLLKSGEPSCVVFVFVENCIRL